MNKIIFIGIGGFIGAVMRFSICEIVQNNLNTNSLPYGTLLVNLLGCFLIGILSYLAESGGFLDPTIHSFLLTGFLGALTTFSTFSSDTVNLFRDGALHLSLLNIFLNLIPGIFFVVLGRKLAVLTSNL